MKAKKTKLISLCFDDVLDILLTIKITKNL